MTLPAAGAVSRVHPRTLGWYGTTALAMGGSNQSLFIIGAMVAGQGAILGQGSAAVPLLFVGLLMSWAAAPGWTELILMYPNRVGGISATCAEAFKPYSAVLANLTGVCYWWGWIPTCGLTALLSAAAIHEWYLPGIPVEVMAIGLVLTFTAVNLCGIRWASRLATVIATASATLGFLSGLIPVLAGTVDWRQAMTFELTVPFPGWFGEVTSLMAGLYLVGFAAPAFEAAACHVGETRQYEKNVPRAMFAAGAVATLFFLILPVIWLGVLGPEPLGHDLALVLGPTYAPLFGSAAKAAAIWFMMLAMFSGTLQPLAGAARCLSQLAEDGLLPESLTLRNRYDAPWVATVFTAVVAIIFLLIGDPIWLVAAANFTYLISIALPSVAVWLLRRDEPKLARPYRAPDWAISLGLWAAIGWGISALLGFEQYGLPTVVIGVGFAYSGALLFGWRRMMDRRKAGQPLWGFTLQVKLTGAMLLVLALDGSGYLLAVSHIPKDEGALLTALSDIFVAVAMLTVAVALILPGMVAHAAGQVSDAARHLADGTMADLSRAMVALGAGDLEGAHARVATTPVIVRSKDEVGEMAQSFNRLQNEIAEAAAGLEGARDGLRTARNDLTARAEELKRSNDELEQFAYVASHDLQEPLRTVGSFTQLLSQRFAAADPKAHEYSVYITEGVQRMRELIDGLLAYSRVTQRDLSFEPAPLEDLLETSISNLNGAIVESNAVVTHDPLPTLTVNSQEIVQLFQNLIANAIKFRRPTAPRIHVDARRQAGGRWIVSVRDNGIGVPPEYAGRIFQLYQRLHTRDRYPGNGIGLAICKKIIDHHGGRIWVEPGSVGSVFHFELPETGPHAQA